MMNGKPSISFNISKLIDEDLVEISDYCKNYVKEFNEKYSEVQMYVTFDFRKMLGARLNLLYNNGGIGLALILITLGLFLSFRLSLWVAWGIPASFLLMFMVAAAYGITINMISVFGMILVVGILVDDGIVIAENIYSHFEKGKSPRRAAIDGTMEVLPAVLTSVSTTIVAFLPLMMIKNERMQMMFEMAFIVIFSLAFSLLEAFFVLPAHLASEHVLRAKKKQNFGAKLRAKLDKGVEWMRDKLYGKVLSFVIKHKWVVSFVPLSLILITMGLFNGGNTRRAIQNAQIDERIGELSIAEIQLQLKNVLANMFDLFGIRKQLYEVSEANLESAELNLKLSEEKFKAGVINSFNFRDIQLLYLNVATQRLESMYNLIDTHTELVRLTRGIIAE